MSDINEWALQYGNQSIEFGTDSSDYPFSAQFEMGPMERTIRDSNHPFSDGIVSGIEQLHGFNLQFDATIYRLDGTRRWAQAMDLYDEFASAWRMDAVRRQPGRYATLVNLDRNRLVYGRTRDIAPKMARVRQGLLDFQMDFKVNGPNWYSATLNTVQLTTGPGPSGRMTAPLIAPLITTQPTQDQRDTQNYGTVETWPQLFLAGPFQSASVELMYNNRSMWVIRVPDRVKHDEVLTIDTRPWNRCATMNGKPANGMLRGDRLEDCYLPIGKFQMIYRATDVTGTTTAAAQWRDAYASI